MEDVRQHVLAALAIGLLLCNTEAAINDYASSSSSSSNNNNHFNYNNYNTNQQQQQQHPYQQQVQQQQLSLQSQQAQLAQFAHFGSNVGSSVGSPAASIGHKPRPLKPLEGDASNRVLDRFSHRYPDGSYEFRYELADGSARYERGYFLLIDKVKTLIVVGYYSYRSPDGRYITVFYNADQNGYRQNQSITPQVYPNLPRSIEVPQYRGQSEQAASTTPFPRVTATITSPTRSGRF